MVEKNSWVSISKVILKPEERTGRIPEETKAVPFVMWVKGHLLEDAEIGDEVSIKTCTGRIETGTLETKNPQYELNYGKFIEELLDIDASVRSILFE